MQARTRILNTESKLLQTTIELDCLGAMGQGKGCKPITTGREEGNTCMYVQ